jgi:hypothetical protein
VTTHATVDWGVPSKSFPISKNATFTMDMSSVEMYEAMAHTVNVAHGERAVGAATAVMISPLVQKLYYVGTMTERTA